LAKALANLGHEVELVFGDVNPGFDIPFSNNFKIRILKKKRVLKMFFNLIKIVKYQNFEIIFSAGDHLNAIVLLSAIISRSSIKVCCSSRVTPYETYSNSNKIFSKEWILKIIMSFVLKRANVLSCVSKDMVIQYKKIFKNSKHVPIYNIIKDSESEFKIKENLNEDWLINKKIPVIISAGMLEPWKGFSDLINAFSKLLNYKKARLIILGDGSLRNELEKQIKDLGISEYVKLKGFVKNPLKYFGRSDIFALTSHVEGMPNVLIEAMMAGCTPVSTDCETGPRELLVNGKFGYLVKVNDTESISKGLLEALENPIKKNILDEAVELFSEEKIIESYSRYLNVNFKQ